MGSNRKSLVQSAGIVLAGIVTATLGYGFLATQGQQVPIWMKDASNVVQLAPKTLSVNLASSTNLTIGTTTLQNCKTATWDPGSMGTSSVALAATSTNITFAGATSSDICVASFPGSNTFTRSCAVTGAGTTTIYLLNVSTTANDPSSATARTCLFK